jgi:hypothetical protein
MSGSSNGCAAKIHYMFVKNEFSMRGNSRRSDSKAKNALSQL